MAEGRFNITSLGLPTSVSLEIEQITGRGGVEYPCLCIPIKLSLRPREVREMIEPYTLLWLKSELYIGVESGKLGIKIGESFSEPIAAYSRPNSEPLPITIEIPLDLYRIKKIEEQRKGDIYFRLSGQALVAMHPPIPKANSNKIQMNVKRFDKGSYDITFTIPQSHWVKNVLPGLGYGEYFIVEIPKGEQIIKEAWSYIEKAEECLGNWNAEGVYVNCREIGKLLDNIVQNKLGDKPSIKKWKRAIGRFDYLASLDLHKEEIKKEKPEGEIKPGKPEAEHLLIVTKALVKYAEELLRMER